jgi:hypothetical protein
LAKGLSHTRPAGSYLSLSFTHHGRILRD